MLLGRGTEWRAKKIPVFDPSLVYVITNVGLSWPVPWQILELKTTYMPLTNLQQQVSALSNLLYGWWICNNSALLQI